MATPTKPNQEQKATTPMFKLTVEGSYWASGRHNQTDLKAYKLTCNIPADRIESVNGILKARILPQLLLRKDVKFKRLRTFTVTNSEAVGDVSFEHLEDTAQVRLMTIPQLRTFVKKRKLDVDVSLYTTIEGLRTAVQLCMESPAFYKAREAKMSDGMELSSELMDLNSDNVIEVSETEPEEDSLDGI